MFQASHFKVFGGFIHIIKPSNSNIRRLFRQPNIDFRSVVVDGRTVAETVCLLGEDFGSLVQHSALDAKHHSGVLDGVRGNRNSLVDDAGTVGAVSHLDDV